MAWSRKDDELLRLARARVKYLEKKKGGGCLSKIGGLISLLFVGAFLYNDYKASTPPKPAPAVERTQSAASAKPRINKDSQAVVQNKIPEAGNANSNANPSKPRETIQNQSTIKVFSRVPGSVSKVTSVNKLVFDSNGGKTTNVQLIGIKAAQSKNLNASARNYLQSLLKQCGNSVQLYSSNYEAGKSKGIKGKVVCNNKDVGLELIRAGQAYFDSDHQRELTPSDQSLYMKAQNDAKNSKVGIWK